MFTARYGLELYNSVYSSYLESRMLLDGTGSITATSSDTCDVAGS